MLHYRIIDVSSFKEVGGRLGIGGYKKTEQLWVLVDIRESMDELRYLLRRLRYSSSPGTCSKIRTRNGDLQAFFVSLLLRVYNETHRDHWLEQLNVLPNSSRVERQPS